MAAAEAARALGLVRAEGALRPLLACLEDPHDEVRAAAVEALGHLGDPGCVPALLRALPDASRHQRARVVEAIRALGPGVAHALVAHARVHPDDLATVAELMGPRVRRAPPTICWRGRAIPMTRCERPLSRRSARSAWTTAPTTTRSGRSATPARRCGRWPRARWAAPARRRRAVSGPAPRRRVAGGRARGHRAAHARSVRRRELSARQDTPGLAGVLARQMLWERRLRPDGGGPG